MELLNVQSWRMTMYSLFPASSVWNWPIFKCMESKWSISMSMQFLHLMYGMSIGLPRRQGFRRTTFTGDLGTLIFVSVDIRERLNKLKMQRCHRHVTLQKRRTRTVDARTSLDSNLAVAWCMARDGVGTAWGLKNTCE